MCGVNIYEDCSMKEKPRDDSLYVYQRDKLKDRLKIKELKWTEKQRKLIELALNKETKLLFVSGPAGTTKTFLAVYIGLKLLDEKRVSELIYVRSAVESADKSLGFLPGDLEEKLHFYNLPFMDKLDELLPKEDKTKLLKEKRVLIHPINFARGLSWNAKCFILDETQNSSLREIFTLATRYGQFSKCIVLADPLQSDLKNGNRGGFEIMRKLYDNEEGRRNGIFFFDFTKEDILRDKLVRYLVEKMDLYLAQNNH